MWKLILSQKGFFFLQNSPEHKECSFHSHEEMFSPIFQKQFLYSLEKLVEEFFPKNTFPPEKDFCTPKMQVWHFRQTIFRQNWHCSCSKSGKRLWRNLLFHSDNHYPRKCPLGKWNGNLTLLRRTLRRKQNLLLEIRKEEKTKGAPKIILFEKFRWTPRLRCDKLAEKLFPNFYTCCSNAQNLPKKVSFSK